MSQALGIDVGTTNAKPALVADDGTIAASASRPIATVRDGDVAEQSPEALWDAVLGAVRAHSAWARAPSGWRDHWLSQADVKDELGVPPEMVAALPIVVGVPDEQPVAHPRRPPRILYRR
jgi:hypothetical protein